jgi:hypothetical protein
MVEATNLVKGIWESLKPSNPYYEKQVAVQQVGGLSDAVMMVSINATDLHNAVLLGVRLGVYLEARNEELNKIQRMLGN